MAHGADSEGETSERSHPVGVFYWGIRLAPNLAGGCGIWWRSLPLQLESLVANSVMIALWSPAQCKTVFVVGMYALVLPSSTKVEVTSSLPYQRVVYFHNSIFYHCQAPLPHLQPTRIDLFTAKKKNERPSPCGASCGNTGVIPVLQKFPVRSGGGDPLPIRPARRVWVKMKPPKSHLPIGHPIWGI